MVWTPMLTYNVQLKNCSVNPFVDDLMNLYVWEQRISILFRNELKSNVLIKSEKDNEAW